MCACVLLCVLTHGVLTHGVLMQELLCSVCWQQQPRHLGFRVISLQRDWGSLLLAGRVSASSLFAVAVSSVSAGLCFLADLGPLLWALALHCSPAGPTATHRSQPAYTPLSYHSRAALSLLWRLICQRCPACAACGSVCGGGCGALRGCALRFCLPALSAASVFCTASVFCGTLLLPPNRGFGCLAYTCRGGFIAPGVWVQVVLHPEGFFRGLNGLTGALEVTVTVWECFAHGCCCWAWPFHTHLLCAGAGCRPRQPNACHCGAARCVPWLLLLCVLASVDAMQCARVRRFIDPAMELSPSHIASVDALMP